MKGLFPLFQLEGRSSRDSLVSVCGPLAVASRPGCVRELDLFTEESDAPEPLELDSLRMVTVEPVRCVCPGAEDMKEV